MSAALVAPTPDWVLPSLPLLWSADIGGFIQRWVPGAFGDLTCIEDVRGFRVAADEWETVENGPHRRTILRVAGWSGFARPEGRANEPRSKSRGGCGGVQDG